MNYINFKYLDRQKLAPEDYLILIQVKQGDIEHLKSFIEGDFAYLINNGFLKVIKGTKKQSFYEKLRVDTKGTKILNEVAQPEPVEEDELIFEWLKGLYKNMNKDVGNGAKTKRHIAAFREKSGINQNKLAYLCRVFIEDEDQMEYSHRLEYIFFKPKHAFQARFTLEESRLYKYYQKKQDFFDAKFKDIN